jgi:hypothetical protein
VLIHADSWTDGWARHDETNRRISQLNAHAPKILTRISDFISPFYREQYKSTGVFTWSASMFFDFNQIWIFSAVFRKRAYRRTDRHDEAKFYVIYTVHVLTSIGLYHPTYALCNTPFILFQHFKVSLIPKLRTEHGLAYCLIYLCYSDSLRMAPLCRNMLIFVINGASQSAYIGWYIEDEAKLYIDCSVHYRWPVCNIKKMHIIRPYIFIYTQYNII